MAARSMAVRKPQVKRRWGYPDQLSVLPKRHLSERLARQIEALHLTRDYSGDEDAARALNPALILPSDRAKQQGRFRISTRKWHAVAAASAASRAKAGSESVAAAAKRIFGTSSSQATQHDDTRAAFAEAFISNDNGIGASGGAGAGAGAGAVASVGRAAFGFMTNGGSLGSSTNTSSTVSTAPSHVPKLHLPLPDGRSSLPAYRPVSPPRQQQQQQQQSGMSATATGGVSAATTKPGGRRRRPKLRINTSASKLAGTSSSSTGGLVMPSTPMPGAPRTPCMTPRHRNVQRLIDESVVSKRPGSAGVVLQALSSSLPRPPRPAVTEDAAMDGTAPRKIPDPTFVFRDAGRKPSLTAVQYTAAPRTPPRRSAFGRAAPPSPLSPRARRSRTPSPVRARGVASWSSAAGGGAAGGDTRGYGFGSGESRTRGRGRNHGKGPLASPTFKFPDLPLGEEDDDDDEQTSGPTTTATAAAGHQPQHSAHNTRQGGIALASHIWPDAPSAGGRPRRGMSRSRREAPLAVIDDDDDELLDAISPEPSRAVSAAAAAHIAPTAHGRHAAAANGTRTPPTLRRVLSVTIDDEPSDLDFDTGDGALQLSDDDADGGGGGGPGPGAVDWGEAYDSFPMEGFDVDPPQGAHALSAAHGLRHASASVLSMAPGGADAPVPLHTPRAGGRHSRDRTESYNSTMFTWGHALQDSGNSLDASSSSSSSSSGGGATARHARARSVSSSAMDRRTFALIRPVGRRVSPSASVMVASPQSVRSNVSSPGLGLIGGAAGAAGGGAAGGVGGASGAGSSTRAARGPAAFRVANDVTHQAFFLPHSPKDRGNSEGSAASSSSRSGSRRTAMDRMRMLAALGVGNGSGHGNGNGNGGNSSSAMLQDNGEAAFPVNAPHPFAGERRGGGPPRLVHRRESRFSPTSIGSDQSSLDDDSSSNDGNGDDADEDSDMGY